MADTGRKIILEALEMLVAKVDDAKLPWTSIETRKIDRALDALGGRNPVRSEALPAEFTEVPAL